MRRAWVAALLALGLTACGYASRNGQTHRFADFPPAQASPGIGRGHELFLRDCAWCHGDDGAGTERAPDLLSAPQGGASVDFMLSTGRMPIDYPDASIRRSDPVYDAGEIADIVAYVDSLGPEGPAVPDVDLAAGSLPLGQELYNLNCAACHSTTGIGGALPAPAASDLPSYRVARSANVIPALLDATPRQVVEAMATGPGPMPVFDLGETQTASIARYVAYLHDPDDRGGANIGSIGPVAEGAAGWILGLGTMLLLVRWIGTTRRDEEDELR